MFTLLCIDESHFDLYTNELKSWFLAVSAWQQIFSLHLRLAIQQWSLVPGAKIGAASLPKFQLLNSFVYILHILHIFFLSCFFLIHINFSWV
jgi:hypothetical protein